jgi:hypothetical protein
MRIVFTLLAVALTALQAAAQNQWLTSFEDNVGDHVYYQAATAPYDLWQIAPTYPWSGPMNQVSLCTGLGDPPPESINLRNLSVNPSPLASFSNEWGQHVVYIDNASTVWSAYGDPSQPPMHPHVRDVSIHSGCAYNLDLSAMIAQNTPPCSLTGDFNDGCFPSDPDGRSLTAFSDDRGAHIYYTGVDGHIHHFSWPVLQGYLVWPPPPQDLTEMAGLTPSSPCGVVNSELTSFSDTRFSPTIELVYYVGGTGHLCELAWYQGVEQSYDLTAICPSPCGDGPPQPMQNSPLTGFTDADGQHLFYLDYHSVSLTDGIHVHEFVAAPNGLSTLDLTARSHGKWASPASLTSFSNSFGPQVFYVDANSSSLNQINVKALTNQDLTGSFGAAPVGTALNGIGNDLKGGQDIYYIAMNRHVWKLHSNDGSTWSPQDLTLRFGTPTAF